MKIISFYILFLLLNNNVLGSSFNYFSDGIGNSKIKTMSLSNGMEYLLYENRIGWTDSLGNYGKSFCFGKIKLNKKIAEQFDLTCESVDQNGDKYWSKHTRANTDMDAGVGQSIFIDGTGMYKSFISVKCIFSTKYLDDTLFFKTKCKADPNIISTLKK
tara:strand:+ start:55 stop:531 length:477 start_codon:yes stop_codon:yes gene_type:complete